MVAWPTYLENIVRDGTYDNHLTLQPAEELFIFEFIVIFSLGPDATTVILPVDSLPLYSFHIGQFAEDDGEPYVRLQNDPIWHDICSQKTRTESNILRAFNKNKAQEQSCSLSETSNITILVTAEHSHAQEVISDLPESDQESASQPPLPPPTSHLP